MSGAAQANSPAHILSVQSHVARDYVGNRACALALQLMGHEVDVVNTVQFSSMYIHQGSIMGLEEIEQCLSGLETVMANPRGAGRVGAAAEHEATCHDLSVVMGGYIGNPAVLACLCEHVERWRKLKCIAPEAEKLASMLGIPRAPLFVMDPVMGDNGHLYVSQEMADEYRERIALADIITPNFYELEWLTNKTFGKSPAGEVFIHGIEDSPTSTKGSDSGIVGNSPIVSKPKSHEDLHAILERISLIHEKGPKFVCVTSCTFESLPENMLLAIASVRPTGCVPFSAICLFPMHDAYLGGCGDVTNAMLVDRLINLVAAAKPTDLHNVVQEALVTTMEAMQVCITKAMAEQSASINVVKLAKYLQCGEPQHKRSAEGSTVSKTAHAASIVVHGDLTSDKVLKAVTHLQAA